MATSSNSTAGAVDPTRSLGRLSALSWKHIALAAFIAVILLLPLILDGFTLFTLTKVMVFVVALMGLNILIGFNGQFSLGHGAFLALGGYVAAIMISRWGVPYYLTVPAAGFVCLIAGFLFGLPALRLEGLYLALATFALAFVTPQILKFHMLEEWTKGVQGISMEYEFDLGPPLFATPLDPAATLEDAEAWLFLGMEITKDQWLYYFTFFVTLIMLLIAWNLLRGRSGRAMVAIRDQRIAAKTMGINLTIYKSWTFGVSTFYVGVAGALLTTLVESVTPESFGFIVSIELLVAMVVGGVASISGAIFGGLFYQFAQDIASDISTNISPSLSWGFYGLFLLAFMYTMPYGIAGFIRIFRLEFRQLWNGTITLDRTYGFYGLVVTTMLSLPLIYAIAKMDFADPSILSVFLITVMGSALAAYQIFLHVAIWRSAANYHGRAEWAWTARVAMVPIMLTAAVGIGYLVVSVGGPAWEFYCSFIGCVVSEGVLGSGS